MTTLYYQNFFFSYSLVIYPDNLPVQDIMNPLVGFSK